ncbi:MAG: ATP-dependent DNA ligase [Candidatus Sumerlaeia bacterium]|nr:ATP-dependent DNA ligase [Candidatus Sumerlaeia bacterium]
MRRFTRLVRELDETTRTNEKVAALERFFREAPRTDAAWALHFLSGGRQRRALTAPRLRALVAARCGLPQWLVDECHEAVGDLAECLALLLPPPTAPREWALADLVETRLLPIADLPERDRERMLDEVWASLSAEERFVWHKLITGAFRIGAGRTLAARALARVAGVPQAVMAHRLMGAWAPSAEAMERLLAGESASDDPARPYPFHLAHQIEGQPEGLGPIAEWQLEWKWDGIRAQLLKRGGAVALWTRGEEPAGARFPELEALGARLPDGTVLDGEVLPWRGGGPLPFHQLQRRIGLKSASRRIQLEVPALFHAYDLLEENGVDLRERPLAERRARLEALVDSVKQPSRLLASPLVEAGSWEEAALLREESRARRVEGLMLKRRDSPYRAGRSKGEWWKWKVDPLAIDAVLVYAQQGHGRRASLYTDCTFALWDRGELVTVAKAYSGLTDREIDEVDAWIKRHGRERRGPVRAVDPELVFELGFEGVQRSGRHRSGVAVRFPRILRWRRDKRPEDADTLDSLLALADLGDAPEEDGDAIGGVQQELF